jgi:hypothetical protein
VFYREKMWAVNKCGRSELANQDRGHGGGTTAKEGSGFKLGLYNLCGEREE